MEPKIEVPKTTPSTSKIEIAALPKKLQDKQHIFDKNNDGYVQGKIEMDLLEPFAKQMGLDLSKYETNTWKSKSKDGSVRTVTVANGGNYQRIDETIEREKYNSNEYRTEHYAFGKIYGANSEIHKNDKSGYNTKYTRSSFTNHQTLVSGKYVLKVMNENYEQYGDYVKTLKSERVIYELNGETVQAKAVGRGRYLITTEKGETFYISHDGFKLKNSYVESNP